MKLTENVSRVYDHYYLYQEITDILQDYAARFPQYTRLTVAGTSPEGRNLWLLEVTDLETGDFLDKPAYYVEGNIHAGEVTGCMCCMYLLDVIFTNIDDPAIRKLLSRYTLYVLPRVSPDGSEYYLTTPNMVRSVPRMYPYEEDMPGLQPADLDGDGVIRKMRVKSPYGIWKQSPRDPRLMTRRRPDDVEGEFYNVYSEGYIEDFDGVHITAAPARHARDFNRNYPIGWQPEHQQRGAGFFPLDNPETQSNAKFLLSHPNVCSVLDMHTAGGQNLYTPGFKSRKDTIAADIAIYKTIGKMAQEENGYPVINVYDEYMPPNAPVTYGGFDDFCHFILGVPAFTIECWDLAPRAGVATQYPPKVEVSDEEQEDEAFKYLQWVDKELDGEGVTEWKPFTHPQLGEVEIGGFDYKRIAQNPPIKFLHQEMEKHVRFMLRQIKTLPNVSFRKVDVECLGADVYKVEAFVMNSGFLPSYIFKEALKLKTLKPLKVELSGACCLQGKAAQEIGHLEGFSGIRGSNSGLGASSMEVEPCEKKVTWIVRGNPGDTLTLVCSGGRIGKVETTVSL